MKKLLKIVFNFLNSIWKNKLLIMRLSKNDFINKYTGSYFGLLWAFLNPITTIVVYWFVFEKGLRTGSMENVPFILWLSTGLIPWFYFSEAWNNGTFSLLAYNYLVKKVVFNVNILPIIKIISASFMHLIFLIIIIIMYYLMGYGVGIYLIQIPYYVICVTILCVGLSYITSAIILFFKDLGQIVGIILQFGIWLTPIMWSYNILPINLLKYFKLNPMYYIVQGYRDSLIYRVAFWERRSETIYFWILTFIILIGGVLLFKKLKVHFSDVL